ncbi:MAG: RluA family pseudouridine synthase [Butyrivibrio sp.]|nr:RluA family pseudouridine synthase [Acetatifactor muris]MCM1558726.1 RluA family pseudouridine synthase [Butyrivibrio sp.]
MNTEIIFEDKDLLVIRKPAGFATQTARVGQGDVVSELKNYIAASGGTKPPYLGIIHRLDQPVEGLLVFAKNKGAAAALTKQLGGQGEERTLHKLYYAVLYGRPFREEGELVDYMYRDMRQGGKAVIAENHIERVGDGGESGAGKQGNDTEASRSDAGKPESNGEARRNGIRGSGSSAPKKAVLQYKILQTVRIPSGEELSLADIRLETGRFHQIRAQMAHAGMALLGDEKYGGEAVRECSRRLGIRTVALCAASLGFVHPVTGKQLHFETKPRSEAFSFFEG